MGDSQGIYIEDQFIIAYYAIIIVVVVVGYDVEKSSCFVIIFDMWILFINFICFVAAPTEEEKRSRKNNDIKH